MVTLTWSSPLLLTIASLLSRPAVSWMTHHATTTTSRQSPWNAFSLAFSRKSPSPLFYSDPNKDKQEEVGLNELHTLLRDAVQKEDYQTAGQISDTLLSRLYPDANDDAFSPEERRAKRKRLSWRGLGAAPWLAERLDALNYTFPTTIQITAMEAANAILNTTDDADTDIRQEDLEQQDFADRMRNGKDMGIVVSGTTGSGKTLAYLIPLLSTLSDSLFVRQRIRVGAEEAVGDTTGDLLDRVAVVTSPIVRSNSRGKQLRRQGAIATGASLSTLGQSGKDVKSPLALIVVPTRELGVQTAMLLYQLIGGNIKEAPDQLSGKANMFKYKGPKGIRIACVLDEEEASFGLKLQTDVAITMPQYLGKLMEDGDLDASKLRVVIYDEADLCLEETKPDDLVRLFDDKLEDREYTRLTLLVGASVTESLGSLAVSSRILPEGGKSYIATATRFAPLESSRAAEESTAMTTSAADLVGEPPKTASLTDLGVCLYPGLKHERVIVPPNTKGLLTLTRLLRKELERSNAMEQRPRVVVFFPDEEQARAAIEPLRDAMWGEHKLCVLLPKTGVNPLTIMDQFKRNETTVMLATANSVRGLDFPALTHVYTLYLPMDDPREYVHLAGRVGRVGQQGSTLGDGGHVVSVLKEEDAGKMDELAAILGFQFTDIDPAEQFVKPPSSELLDTELEEGDPELERMRRYLEDTIAFVDLVDDPQVDEEAMQKRVIDVEAEDDTDDEIENDDEEEMPYQ